MSKATSIFVCSDCGNESPKWFGKCPACNSWNTCYEEKINSKLKAVSSNKKNVEPTILNNVEKQNIQRTSTGFEELDRVLRWRTCKRFINSSRRRTTE